MTKTEIARDAASLLGAALLLAGLWLIWPPLTFLTAGATLLAMTGVIGAAQPRRRDGDGA